MLIKQKVIEKALKKVREDIQITQAIDSRLRCQELGIKQFRDDNIASQFNELPPQLQPNKEGLTDSQFQVYEDFQLLSQHPESELPNSGNSGASGSPDLSRVAKQ